MKNHKIHSFRRCKKANVALLTYKIFPPIVRATWEFTREWANMKFHKIKNFFGWFHLLFWQHRTHQLIQPKYTINFPSPYQLLDFVFLICCFQFLHSLIYWLDSLWSPRDQRMQTKKENVTTQNFTSLLVVLIRYYLTTQKRNPFELLHLNFIFTISFRPHSS